MTCHGAQRTTSPRGIPVHKVLYTEAHRLVSLVVVGFLIGAVFVCPPVLAGSDRSRSSLTSEERALVELALRNANIRPDLPQTHRLTAGQRYSLSGTVARILIPHIIARVPWTLVEQSPSPASPAQCMKTLKSLHAPAAAQPLLVTDSKFDLSAGHFAANTVDRTHDFMTQALPHAVTEWFYSTMTELRSNAPSIVGSADAYGHEVPLLEKKFARPYMHPPGLFNFYSGSAPYLNEYLVPYHIHLQVIHVEGLPANLIREIASTEFDIGAVYYLYGSKYLVAECDDSDSARSRSETLAPSCEIRRILYTPVRNYSIIDQKSQIVGLHHVFNVGDLTTSAPNVPPPGGPWLIEIFSQTETPDALVLRLRSMRLSASASTCTYQGITDETVFKLEEWVK